MSSPTLDTWQRFTKWPGGKRVSMRDRRLRTRWIIFRYSSEYLKKARGTVTAECIIERLDPNTRGIRRTR